MYWLLREFREAALGVDQWVPQTLFQSGVNVSNILLLYYLDTQLHELDF